MRSTTLFAAMAFVALAAAPGAQAQEGRFLVRMRPVYISPANHSDAIPALGVQKDAITVTSKVIPEVDLTFFLSRYFAAELVLTYPQEHDVKLNGAKIGTFSHLPPSLLVQAHLPLGRFDPYVGAGVNLTLITATDLEVPSVGELELERASVGVAGQAGMDVRLYKRWSLNLDVKYVTIRSDVKLKSTGAKVSEVRVDPWLFGGGLAYRF
jgi:outer membrane protein